MKLNRKNTAAQIRESFDISDRTLFGWIRRGCPCSGKGKARRFDEAEVASWLKQIGLSGNVGRPADSALDDSDPLKRAKLRKETALAEKHETEASRIRASLIDRSELTAANAIKTAKIKSVLSKIPKDVAGKLAGLDVQGIAAVLDGEIAAALLKLSRM